MVGQGAEACETTDLLVEAGPLSKVSQAPQPPCPCGAAFLLPLPPLIPTPDPIPCLPSALRTSADPPLIGEAIYRGLEGALDEMRRRMDLAREGL